MGNENLTVQITDDNPKCYHAHIEHQTQDGPVTYRVPIWKLDKFGNPVNRLTWPKFGDFVLPPALKAEAELMAYNALDAGDVKVSAKMKALDIKQKKEAKVEETTEV